MHEAAANAIEHSGSSTDVLVRARLAENEVAIEVTNAGGWKEPDDENDERGRGLRIIRGLVDRVFVTADNQTTMVRLERAVVPPRV